MSESTIAAPDAGRVATRHLRFGWWSLLVFLMLGLVLDVLHGFKVQWYLSVAHETRRLMWTLAHAHGVLLGVVHVVFALTLRRLPSAGSWALASSALIGASLLLPGGFFLGGIWLAGDDPGIGVFLAPIGGVLLLLAVLAVARATTRTSIE